MQDTVYGVLVPLFLFSSPIFAYYTNSFIIDVSALSFALIAWYFFFSFYRKKKNISLLISILFFTLAGLTKITALISFIPLLFLALLELLNIRKTIPEKKLFNKPLRQIPFLLLPIFFVASWTMYAIHYNNIHLGGVFSTEILPFWKLDSETKRLTLEKLYNDLLPQYFNFSALMMVLVLFFVVIISYKKVNAFLLYQTSAVFVGSLLYIVLWFKVFNVHDYYLINLLIFVPFVLLTFLN